MNTKTKHNFFYQIAYQVLIVLVPLITAPYVSRVLGPDGIGVQSYYASMINYFVIVAMLGLNTYGNRMVAMVRDDMQALNRSFSGLLYLHFILSGIVMAIACLGLLFLSGKDRLIYGIYLLMVLTAVFDINWLYYGLEDIGNIVIKNVLIKIVSTVIIFLFVKSSDDLWIYCLSLTGSQLLGTVILWLGVKKRVRFVKVSFKEVFAHLKPLLVLFLPLVAINLYKYMDKLMLFWMSSSEQTGYYENAEKIVSIPNNILSAVGLVMLPYCSNLAAQKRFALLKKQVVTVLQVILFLSIPLTFGLAAVSFELAPLYFGEAFKTCGILICLLSLTLFPLVISSVVRTQYLIPLKMDRIFVISLFAGAAVNVVMNALLIPSLAGIGAVLGTIGAEYSVCIIQMVAVRKDIRFGKTIVMFAPYFAIGALMFLAVRGIAACLPLSWGILVLQVLAGGMIYVLISLPVLYIFQFDWFAQILSYLKLNKICVFLTNRRCRRKLKKVSRIPETSIEYHISFDDVALCFKNLNKGTQQSVFDDAFLKMLCELHQKYGTAFTLNIYKINQFIELDPKYYQEFRDNAHWLRLSFHAVDDKPLSPDYDITGAYSSFFDKVKNIDPDLQLLDRFVRLEGFAGTAEQMHVIMNKNGGHCTFFSADDDREQGGLAEKDIAFVRTNLRIDNISPKPTTGAALHSFDLYDHCAYSYFVRHSIEPLVAFGHEWFFYDGQRIQHRESVEQLCRFVNEYKLQQLQVQCCE